MPFFLNPPKRRKVDSISGSNPIVTIHFKTFNLPLISAATNTPSNSIHLVPDHSCIIGRSKLLCKYVFRDPKVSRTHCEILYFDGKVCIFDSRRDVFSRQEREVENGFSLNGIFVNGVKIDRGKGLELCVGDEVLLACKKVGACAGSRAQIGFLVESIETNEIAMRDVNSGGGNGVCHDKEVTSPKCGINIGRLNSLLSYCKYVAQSDDPINCIRNVSASAVVDARPVSCNNRVGDNKICRIDNTGVCIKENEKQKVEASGLVSEGNTSPEFAGQKRREVVPCSPPGRKFYLNGLASVDGESSNHHPVVSLPELLHPVDSLSGIFIATFTIDALWFMSCCNSPIHVPVTIACHNTERCWSANPENWISVPYSDFPNLVLVYPPFPEALAFGADRKKQGIACHHPKLLVLLREESIRVIISSANLVEKQWSSITNTIWWQDFPRASAPDYMSLFNQLSDERADHDSGSDFVAQLATFMASLVTDVHSQAHWIVELANYDFRGALGHLVVSTPGLHSYRSLTSESLVSLHADRCKSHSLVGKFLGSVETSVVGSSHLFCRSTDSNGLQLKRLAGFLRKCNPKSYGMSEIILRRNTNIPADANAVSVLVPNPAFPDGGTIGVLADYVQLGFLPRSIAKWVSPLWDSDLFRFSGHICPKEALLVALDGNNRKVRLVLYVSQGPCFGDMSRLKQAKHVSALCSLVGSIQWCVGLWRLEEVLARHRWPDLLETDFFYGASSIGSSISPQFLAAFSAAVGKRTVQFSDSESDPEWGCWNASQESRSPSIKIVFPTIERVKNASCGILPSKRILCFPERTWQRLKTLDMFHDAVPHPRDRVGHPMHVKVAKRRFQSKTDASSFGWVYSGSHNFSAAAWGRSISSHTATKRSKDETVDSSLGLRLHVCNYELGILFVFPPPKGKCSDEYDNSSSLDDIILPFVAPPPKYGTKDRPATFQAMREAIAEKERQRSDVVVAEETTEDDFMNEEEVVEITDDVEEKEEESAYAEILWSQVDSSQSH